MYVEGYEIYNERGHYVVYTNYGEFVASADSYDEGWEEAQEHKMKTEVKKVKEFNVSCLMARCKWITRDGRKIQVATENFYRYFFTIEAKTKEEAIDKIANKNGYLVRDIQVF